MQRVGRVEVRADKAPRFRRRMDVNGYALTEAKLAVHRVRSRRRRLVTVGQQAVTLPGGAKLPVISVSVSSLHKITVRPHSCLPPME